MARGMTEAHRLSPGGAPPRATLSNALTEKQFQAQIMELLQVTGWLAHHHYDARRSAPGLPDIIATHPDHGLLFAELKRANGRVTVDQQRWLEALHQTAAHLEGLTAHSRHNGASWCTVSRLATPRVVVGLFRPDAWDWLEKISKGDVP